jgi:hypothetical protein
MVAFFATLIKLTVIFLGSGIITLLACWIVNETKSIAKLIMLSRKKTINDSELVIIKTKQVVADNIGFYEAVLPSGKSIKIFSSDSGMRVI